MAIIAHTTRFGVFPALRLGNFYGVKFSGRKFGFFRSRAVETKNGVCDIIGLNVGTFLLMRETQSSL